MNIEISKQLESDVFRILDESGKDNLFKISCVFKSWTNQSWSWEVRDLFEFDIVQNFIQNYTDLITMSFHSRPFEYMDLVEYSQDLFCEVEIKRIKHFQEDLEDVVHSFTYRAIIKEKKDLSRMYPINMIREKELSESNEQDQSNKVIVEVDLIDPVAYDARKRKINLLLRNATMSDMILTIASAFDIDNVYFVKPDNEKVYENFWIPPSMGVSEVFGYLQEYDAFGIYDYGARAYITQGILYLYPLFDLNPAQSPSTHIHIVGEQMFHGFKRYDKTIDNVLHIVSNSGTDEVSLIEEGIENEGNWFMVQQPGLLIDVWRSMKEEAFNIDNEAMLSLIMQPEKAMTTDAYSPVNVVTDNIHKVKSKMASSHLTMMALRWNQAFPFNILPGQVVALRHDTRDGYKRTNSIPVSTAYAFRELKGINVGVETQFNCTCNLNLMCQLSSE